MTDKSSPSKCVGDQILIINNYTSRLELKRIKKVKACVVLVKFDNVSIVAAGYFLTMFSIDI